MAISADTRRLTIAAIVTGAVIRLIVAALLPVFPDEAYYWEWSRHLAAGYFDHPPAVAWIIAAGTVLLGHTPLGVRLGSVVTGAAAICCIVAIAKRLGGDRAGLLASLILLCTPLATLGLTLATTDAPALLAISAALLCIVNAIDAEPASAASTRWWLAAGAAFGCGLLTKLTVLILGATVGVALFARPGLRRQLRSPGPWAAVVVAAIVATPLIWWNAHHDWISLRFQLSHGLGAPRHGSIFGREVALIGGQAALLSPGVFILAFIAAARAVRPARTPLARSDQDRRFLLAAVGSLFFAFFLYSAIRRPVEANWPAPAFAALIPLAALPSGLTFRRWIRPALAIGAVFVAIALVQLVHPVLPIPARRDPIARAHGWDVLATAADAVRDRAAAETRGPVWLGADRFQDAAEIAFHARGHPEVFSLNLGGRPNQYDLWPDFPHLARRGDGLVVALDTGTGGADVARRLRVHFDDAIRGPDAALLRGGDTISVRGLWTFRGWRGSWPRESPGRR